jgi:hypothetical protein
MPPLKYLFIIVILFAAMERAAFAEENVRSRMVGMWDELPPGENLVSFTKEGACKIYLKKGEIGDLRSLDGTWVIDSDGKLQITFSVNGQTIDQKATIKFEGEEMILTDEGGTATRHRRHTGPIPDKYQ